MVSIREVQDKTAIAQVAELAREIWVKHYVGIVSREQVDYMLDKFQSESAIATHIGSGYRYALVVENETPRGYLALVRDPDGQGLMISKIYVLAERRGTGLGKAALDWAAQCALEQDCAFLWLTVNKDNHAAIAWYQRRGFVNQGPIVQDIGNGFVMDDFKMVKPLR